MIARLLSFAGKANQRGFGYVSALSRYHAHRLQYRIRAPQILKPGLSIPRFYFEKEEIPSIVRSVPDHLKQHVLQEADRILKGRFVFRGMPEIYFPGLPDWNLCPERNLSWNWDLNRHQYFLSLGTGYHYSGRGELLSTLISLWTNWISQNPAGEGQNWQSPFEVAARLGNWIWSFFLLAASPSADESRLAPFVENMQAHADFLADHLEYHWPNNHLLLEAITLYQYAVLFEGPASCHARRAWEVLEREIPSQILEDGTHAELCSMYHEIIAGELDALQRLSGVHDSTLPGKLEQRISRMRQFSAALRRTDGSFPLLGDSSAQDTCLRFEIAGQPRSDLIYWMDRGRPVTNQAEDSEISLSTFPEGGYAFLKTALHGGTHLTFDFGKFNRSQCANHGHCDALSFEIYAGGRPWIVDPGFFYPWSNSREWPTYFRSTAAHNTLLVDGREQSDLSKFWDVGRTVRTRLKAESRDLNKVSIEAEAEPYWSSDLIHNRRVCLDGNGTVRIRDRVLGKTKCHLQWLFHFASDIDITSTEPTLLTAQPKDGGTRMTCDVRTTLPCGRWNLVRGQRKPLQGWVAASSARVKPAWVAIWEAESDLPVEVEFIFRTGRGR